VTVACKKIYTPLPPKFPQISLSSNKLPGVQSMLDISTFILEYLVSHSPETEKAYRSDLLKFQEFLAQEEIEVKAVRPIHIREYIKWLSYRRNRRTKRRGLSEDTVRRHIAAVRAYYEWLRFSDQRLLDPTSFFRFRRGEEPRKVHGIPGPVLDTMCDPHLARKEEIAIIKLFRRSGIRLSELIGANRNSLEVVQATAQAPRHARLRVRGKGRKTRTVLISDDALEAIKEYLLERRDRNPALFLSSRGLRIGKRTVQRIIARLGAASDCDDAHPHRIRHGYAEDMLDHGMKPEVLQILMGHEELQTTVSYVDKLERSSAQEYHAAIEMINQNHRASRNSAKSRRNPTSRRSKPTKTRAA
jgi:integrase/recombinase XerC